MPKVGAGVGYSRYLVTSSLSSAFGSLAFAAAGRVWLSWFEVSRPCLVDRLLYQVGSAKNGNIRMGLYGEGATPDSPVGAALIVESASVAQGDISYIQLVTVVDTLLVPGLYFLALQGDDATGTARRKYHMPTGVVFYYNRAGGYGAFTDPCPALTDTTNLVEAGARVKTNLPLGQQM